MEIDKNQEEILIRKIKKDISNFKELYQIFAKKVYRYCYYRVNKNTEIAEDITSDTFLRALENFDKFEYKNKSILAWLYTIAHNLIVDFFKNKAVKDTVSFDETLNKITGVEDNLIEEMTNEELFRKVNANIDKLPDEIKEIFILKFSEDQTFNEIAKIIGKNEGAVKMQFYRGLKLLKKQIFKT